MAPRRNRGSGHKSGTAKTEAAAAPRRRGAQAIPPPCRFGAAADEPISHDMPRGSPWLAWRET